MTDKTLVMKSSSTHLIIDFQASSSDTKVTIQQMHHPTRGVFGDFYKKDFQSHQSSLTESSRMLDVLKSR